MRQADPAVSDARHSSEVALEVTTIEAPRRPVQRNYVQSLLGDWQHPNYTAIWKRRIEILARLEADPALLYACKLSYKHEREGLAEFIDDWGVTVDPRNANTERPVIMPFILWPRQRELVLWIRDRWLVPEDGTVVKSRDCGASWIAMGTSVGICTLWEDASIGFGSATEDKVDAPGQPDCLFYKGRAFVQYLPPMFRPGWDLRKHSGHMRLGFPHTGSTITGDAGDRIGRGGRKSLNFVDEFAHVLRPKLVDANLIANSDCRIEMSSVLGTANVFAERARGGLIPRFDFHYRDDPRKVISLPNGDIALTPAFAAKKAKADPVVWAQEYECDFLASVEGVILPAQWVAACIGAHLKLGIEPTGVKRGSFDVADQGKDANCYGSRHGILVRHCESWKGKGSDIFESTERSFRLADQLGDEGFSFDGDGLGAGVRGDARKIIEERETKQQREVRVTMFRGSGEVQDKESICEGTDRKNEDFFENYKAQSWWALRRRVNITWRAVTGVLKKGEYSESDIISLDPNLPELTKTVSELSQPVWKWSKSGKMMVDKTPDDVASPNNADTVMMLFPYSTPAWVFPDELFDQL